MAAKDEVYHAKYHEKGVFTGSYVYGTYVEWLEELGLHYCEDISKVGKNRKLIFYCEKLAINLIDIKASMNNQARALHGAFSINEENVYKYAKAVVQGSRLPVIIVLKLANGIYVIIDGNHRFALIMRDAYGVSKILAEFPEFKNVTHVYALVIEECKENEEAVNRILGGFINNKHGSALSYEQNLAKAINDVVAHGRTVESSAADHFISVNVLRKATTNRKAVLKFDSLGFNSANFGSEEIAGALAKIANKDPKLTEPLVKVICENNKLTPQQKLNILNDLNNIKDVDERREKVAHLTSANVVQQANTKVVKRKKGKTKNDAEAFIVGYSRLVDIIKNMVGKGLRVNNLSPDAYKLYVKYCEEFEALNEKFNS